MAKKKILVLTDNMPWGHRSIAKAIYGFLKKEEKKEGVEVYYAEVKAETGVAGDAYVFAYRFLPVSNRLGAWVMERGAAKKMVSELSAFNLPALKKVVNWIKPDLIISTYWFHSHSLQWWRQKEKLKFKLWTVVADPWTIVTASFVPGADLQLVYDERGVRLGLENGIKEENILKTGWWVRPEMYQKYDREKIRRKLGFKDDRPVIFVGGGSLGTNSLTKLLPALMLLKRKAGFVFNTGTDKMTYNLVEEYIKLYKKLKGDDQVIIKHIGWIDNMAEVLAGVDMVFGKAGPNFLFDCVASKKPFVAITHIGGQEDGNVDLIRKKGLGWVKEKRSEAANFLLEYLEKPKKFEEKYRKTIEKEAKENQKSMGIILKRIKKDLKDE